jgi:hypothetical protein
VPVYVATTEQVWVLQDPRRSIYASQFCSAVRRSAHLAKRLACGPQMSTSPLVKVFGNGNGWKTSGTTTRRCSQRSDQRS